MKSLRGTENYNNTVRKAFCQNYLELFLVLTVESPSYLENSLVLDTYVFKCYVFINLFHPESCKYS